MNKNLSEAISEVEKADALMFAYEKTYLDLEVEPEEREKADMANSAFYAIWDTIKSAVASRWGLPRRGCHLRRRGCPSAEEHLEKRELSDREGPGEAPALLS